MPTVFTLASAAIESAIPAVVLGTALVILVAMALRICAPVNAATRALVWLATLAALPLIQGVYFASHLIPAAPVQGSSLVIVQPASTRPSILLNASIPLLHCQPLLRPVWLSAFRHRPTFLLLR